MRIQLYPSFATLAVTIPVAYGAIYDDVTDLSDSVYDYVIVGGVLQPGETLQLMFNAFAGGTAGLAVASRLSEILAFKVLVLEAGISWVPLDRVLRDVA
jgi:hypothetical protein